MNILPLCELNVPNNTHFKRCLDGLPTWQHTTGTVIVSSDVKDYAEVYKRIMAEKPNDIEIIPGIKTRESLQGDFASAIGWQQIADAAAEAVGLTGLTRCWLDNESALDSFHRGRQGIDDGALRKALEPVAALGIDILLWFPHQRGNDSGNRRREYTTHELAHVMSEALPSAKFVVPVTTGESTAVAVRLRHMMIALVGRERIVTLAHVQPGHWTVPDFIEMFGGADGPIIVETGSEYFAQAAVDIFNRRVRGL